MDSKYVHSNVFTHTIDMHMYVPSYTIAATSTKIAVILLIVVVSTICRCLRVLCMQRQMRHWLAGWLAAGKRFSIVFTTNINQIVSSAWQPKECFRFFIFICFTFFLVFSMLVVIFWPICANAPAIYTAAIPVSAMSQHLSMPPTQGVAGERLFTPPFCAVAANFLRISFNNGVPTKTVPTRTPTKSRWRQQILCNKPDRQTPLQKHVDICRFMHIHTYINVCKSVCSSTPPGPYCLNLLAKLLRSAFVCRAKGRRFVL